MPGTGDVYHFFGVAAIPKGTSVRILRDGQEAYQIQDKDHGITYTSREPPKTLIEGPDFLEATVLSVVVYGAKNETNLTITPR